MWISCKSLADAGIISVSCCLSCHDDADDGWDWEMCGIYEDDVISSGKWDKLIGSVCCAVRNSFEMNDPRIAALYRNVEPSRIAEEEKEP